MPRFQIYVGHKPVLDQPESAFTTLELAEHYATILSQFDTEEVLIYTPRRTILERYKAGRRV